MDPRNGKLCNSKAFSKLECLECHKSTEDIYERMFEFSYLRKDRDVKGTLKRKNEWKGLHNIFKKLDKERRIFGSYYQRKW